MEYLGPAYVPYLKAHLPPGSFMPDQHGFNCAILRIDGAGVGAGAGEEDRYLVSVRFFGDARAYQAGARIVPGNYSGQRPKLSPRAEAKIAWGENFMWNRWLDDGMVDNTVLLVMRLTPRGFVVDPRVQPAVIHDVPVPDQWMKYADIRLIKDHRGRILCYDAYVTALYEVAVDVDAGRIRCAAVDASTSSGLFVQKGLCLRDKAYDKNWAFMYSTASRFYFLNRFGEHGVTMTAVPRNSDGRCHTKVIVEYGKDSMYSFGRGPPVNGTFSMGTPFHTLRDDRDAYEGLAAGHVKLSRGVMYGNQNVAAFVRSLKKLFHEDSRTTVIMHASHHYLSYFIHVRKDKRTGKHSIFVSDAFLVNPSAPAEYNFSINFPVGIDIRRPDGHVVVSMGVGDFYTAALHLELDTVLASCVHDVSRFQAHDYDYRVLDIAVR